MKVLRASVLSAAAIVLAFGSPALAAQASVQWSPVAAGMPRTAAEETGFDRHTRHLEMWDYLKALQGQTTEMRLGTYGQTHQGRDLAYAVFGRPLVAEPWEAHASGKPTLVLAANVHGGERTFREGLLILMRDFVTPGTEAHALLDRVNVVVAPQINPDGFEATERGQRGNAWGIDMNRDYVKLEQPSIVNYVTNVISEWRPHLFVDGHNGGSRPYNLNYQCPSHVDPALEITEMCDMEIFPAIDAKLESEGYKGFWYTGGDEEEWRVGGSQARIGRNYGGFVNSVGILFEAPNQTLDVGARAGYLGYLAVVEWAANNASRLMGVIQDAQAETLAMGNEPYGDVTVEMRYEAEDWPVTYEYVPNGGRGTNPAEPVETQLVENGRIIKKPVAVRTRTRPWAYTLPRDAVDAVAMLQRHGITVERLTESVTVPVQTYTVASVSHERAYNHAAATMVEVGAVQMQEMELPAGTYLVRTGQVLGRLVAHMLEVETEDNVVYWNTMDAWVPRPDPEADEPALVPIFKLMAPTALHTELLH